MVEASDMLIQHKDMKTDVTDPKINSEGSNNSRLSQIVMAVRSFYNKHFPTDSKTYSLRVTFVGMILSLISLHLVTTKLISQGFFNNDSRNYAMLKCYLFAVPADRYELPYGLKLLIYCYVFVAAAVGYELSYGIKIGDQKHYTPWILFKLIEVCLVFITIVRIFYDNKWCPLDRYIGDIIYGFIVLGFNFASTFYVISASCKQFRKIPPNTEVNDNISDNNDTTSDQPV